ncbi:MAG TPA: hypothetical protein VN578_01525 [Candidatus Binatia bacterium]|jgi:hypothetical protein|nr:hypothetical protein [Candidatus Binatia bacterium]
MKLRIGPPVTGEDFYPRPQLIQTLTRALKGGHVAFLGPRRTGKTSCLKSIVANPPAGYVPLLLNLEKHHCITDWLEEMVAATRVALNTPAHKLEWLKGKGAEFLKRLEKIEFHGVKIELAGSKRPVWRPAADAFLRLLKESDAPLLFLLDEFPAFLNLVVKKTSRDEVEAALNWFRAARHELSDCSARFLVTGSIGLKSVVRRLGLSPTINDFDVREIPPLKDAEALDLLERLAADNAVPLDEPGCRHILQLLGANWPILLQLFVSEIQNEALAKPPAPAALERLYRDSLVCGSRNKYCDNMFDRLKEIFSESECRLAREILRTLCRAPRPFSRKDLERIHAGLIPQDAHRSLLADELDYVLDALKHDGYLLQAADGDQRTGFASHILRDYWRRKIS